MLHNIRHTAHFSMVLYRKLRFCKKQKYHAQNILRMFHTCLPVIKDWSLSNPNSHLAGGMTYQDGKLTVPLPGLYYIYAQIYFVGVGRVQVNVNNGPKYLIQSNTNGGDGSLNAGGVYNLKAGDFITLTAISAYNSPAPKLYMYGIHTFFGAVLM